MKLGCSTFSFHSLFESGQWTIHEFLRECASLGLDGAELQDRHLALSSGRPCLEKDYWAHLKEETTLLGLKISCISSPEIFLDIADPTELQKRIKRFREWITIAYLIDVPFVRIFPADIALLKECADYAESHNVTLVLENHGGLTQTADGYIGLIHAVNSLYLRFNLDTGNFEDDLYENLKKSIETLYVRHTHLKHFGYQPGPWIDNPKVISWLFQNGYNGYLSIEYEGPRIGPSGENLERKTVSTIAHAFRNRLSYLNRGIMLP